MTSVPFTELPEAFKRLQQHLLRKPGGDQGMVEILFVLPHDEQVVLATAEMAL